MVDVQGISQKFLPFSFSIVPVAWREKTGTHAELLVDSENARIPKHSYLQVFTVKHAVYIM